MRAEANGENVQHRVAARMTESLGKYWNFNKCRHVLKYGYQSRCAYHSCDVPIVSLFSFFVTIFWNCKTFVGDIIHKDFERFFDFAPSPKPVSNREKLNSHLLNFM